VSRGVFVTGTDTGVGKTLVSCALIHALRAHGVAAIPMKPVAAGAYQQDGRWLNDDTEALMAAAGCDESLREDVTPILLREAMAPHIAARREGIAIDLVPVEAAFARLAARSPFVVVEGVGGFAVPLGKDLDTVDLARALGLPVILVVGIRLGCLNHAILTVQAIEASGLRLAGWIANCMDPAMAAAEENIAALEERIAAPLLGTVPHAPQVDARSMASHFDAAELLERIS
jgi:dethiobiotin synthetase